MADNGLKMSYIKDQFGIAKNTYYYYFNLIAKYQILEQLYRELIVENTTLGKNDFIITDTFTVKSMGGSQGLGRNPTDRGRKGLTVSLICDQKLVAHAVHVVGANIHDAKI